MHKHLAASVSVLLIISTVFLLFPISSVSAETATSLTQVYPTSGIAGENITIQGTISTLNGTYQILLNDTSYLTGTAVLYDVDTVFTVPETPAGNYILALKDVSSGSTINQTFTVLIGYSIEALVPSSPEQLQEGNSVTLNVNVTGGQVGTSYVANITVALPTGGRFSQTLPLSSTSSSGTAKAQTTFPGNFSGSSTNYTGTYTAYFNQSESLAYDQFTVGLTDSLTYHRNQNVQIQALGYQPGENANLTITNTDTSTTLYTENLTADSGGIFGTAWVVPSDALIGNYKITLTPQTTNKTVNDTQSFTIPGYQIKVRILNLASQFVPSISIGANDTATNTTYNGTTGSDGTTTLNLEVGTHVITAYYLDVQVGQITRSITGEATYNITCQLANINVTVKNTSGFLLRNVDLTLVFQYVSSKNGSTCASTISGQTDKYGNYVFNSTLTGISYTLNASVYDSTFNIGNNTIPNLPAQPTYQVIIICPTKNLTLTILDSTDSPIANARLTIIELTNGIFQNTTTDNAGTANLQLTFGKYQLRVYSGNILLNSTLVEVFGDSQETIQCSCYGIQVTVKVVDFLGQPISNANVTLFNSESERLSYMTGTNGTVTFDNEIGGNMKIVAYPSGMENNYQTVSLTVDNTTTILVKMGQFISLGPLLIGINAFAVAMLTVFSLIMFILLILFHRKKWFSMIKTKMLK